MRNIQCIFVQKVVSRTPPTVPPTTFVWLFGCEWAGDCWSLFELAGSFWSAGSSTRLINSSSLRIFFWKAATWSFALKNSTSRTLAIVFAMFICFDNFKSDLLPSNSIAFTFQIYFGFQRNIKSNRRLDPTWVLGWSTTVGRIQILF